jgi:hypothetical protein
MKTLVMTGLVMSLSAFAAAPKYAPNDGTVQPGNPGTYTTQNAGVERATDNPETLERSNTSATPIPTDTTTLEEKSQKVPDLKQSQESDEEKLDYRTNPEVDHNDQDASENQ